MADWHFTHPGAHHLWVSPDELKRIQKLSFKELAAECKPLDPVLLAHARKLVENVPEFDIDAPLDPEDD